MVVNGTGRHTTAPLEEIGVTGIVRSAGQVDDEQLPELRGRNKINVIKQMTQNDPVIGALTFAFKMLIRQMKFRIDPASQDNAALEIAEFIDGAMFHDMSMSWKETISDIVSFLWYGYCLPPDQLVLMGNGEPRPIADISVGDLVLTGRGRARRVSHVFTRRHAGSMVTLKMRGYPHPVRMTPEHRVPTLDGWKQAGDLSVGDTLLRPRPKMLPDGDYDAGWIVGVYLAEGHLPKDKRHLVHFAVHRKELDILAAEIDRFSEANQLINRYGETPRARTAIRKPNGGSVTVSSPHIRQMIEEWVGGDRATNKHLRKMPDSSEFARGIWEGWIWGDGHEATITRAGRDYRVASAATVSRTLAHQMQLIGGALGYPSPLVWRKGGYTSVLKGREITGPSYWQVGAVPERFVTHPLRVSQEQRDDARSMRADGKPWRMIAEKYGVTIAAVRSWLFRERSVSPHGLQCHVRDGAVEHVIQSVDHEEYTGTVYDLEIEQDHTFCAGPVVVSNSYHETVYKIRDGDSRDPSHRSRFTDGRIGWRKWPIRSQDTLWEWQFDENGGTQAFVQSAPPDYTTRIIPIEKALLFRTESNRGNPEGLSILRTAYRPWRYKSRIENIEAIGVERDLVGYPVAWLPPSYMDASTATAGQTAVYEYAKKMVTAMRRDEWEGAVMPQAYDANGNKLFDVTLLSTGGTRQFDTGAIITRYDQRMLMSVLADFMLLGAQQHGSWALSSDKTDLFAVALGAWVDGICDVVNTHGIPRLIRLNGMAPDLNPTLAHEDISSKDVREFSDSVSKLLTAGGLTPDNGLENAIRETMELPPLEDVTAP
jgi:hypothetical protein